MKEFLNSMCFVLGVVIIAAILLNGCATVAPAGRPIYIGGGQGHDGYVLRESQFRDRLEYLRFCNHYWLHTKMCVD